MWSKRTAEHNKDNAANVNHNMMKTVKTSADGKVLLSTVLSEKMRLLLQQLTVV